MSRKNKFGEMGGIPEATPELPIQDDPYWKVSGIFSDIQRIGRYLERFDRFGDMHPKWADDIMEGFPTYYCVLGVHRGATMDQIVSAHKKSLNPPFYPIPVLHEAFLVLSNPRLQALYDNFLFVFEQYTKCLPPFEKKELIQKHTDAINAAKKFDFFMQVRNKFGDYCSLFVEGMPDLYEYSGLAKDSDIETIKRDCRNDSELQKKIYSILTTPSSRQEYDLLMAFIAENLNPEGVDNRKSKRELWKKFDREMVEKIILLSLTEPDVIDKYFKRFETILNINQDWREYLPPSKESFFSILGLDAGVLHADKKEVEGIIRDKYRQLERTSRVNLAYSVLKNQVLRDDYLWLSENYTLINILFGLFSVKRVQKPITKRAMTKRAITLSTIKKILRAASVQKPAGRKK